MRPPTVCNEILTFAKKVRRWFHPKELPVPYQSAIRMCMYLDYHRKLHSKLKPGYRGLARWYRYPRKSFTQQ